MKAKSIIAVLTIVGLLVFMAVSVFGGSKEKAASLGSLDTKERSVPGHINYQGYLVNSWDSSAVSDILEMTFEIYDVETGGSPLWSETHLSVEVRKGLFTVPLGSINPIPEHVHNGRNLWIQRIIDGEELQPRNRWLEPRDIWDLDISDIGREFHCQACWIPAGDNCYFSKEGNVGIGTMEPSKKLEVYGIGDATIRLHGETAGGTSSDVDLIAHSTLMPPADFNQFLINIDGFTRFAISDVGNVGIGTGTAFPLAQLEVAGTAHLRGAPEITGLCVNGDGNVGIGTTSPDYTLDVGGDMGLSGNLYHNDDGDTYLRFTNDQIDMYAGDVCMITADETTQDAVVINEGSADVDFRVESDGDANALFVRGSDGNVGIKEEAPLYDLDVDGNTRVQDDLKVEGTIELTFDYNSGWVSISEGETKTIAHYLGDDASKYIVYVDGKTDHGGFIHQANSGTAWIPSLVGWRGLEWHSLNSDSLKVSRGNQDNEGDIRDWDQVRVRILKNQ